LAPDRGRAAEVLSIWEAQKDILLEELRVALAEAGLIVSVAGLHRFFARRGITRKLGERLGQPGMRVDAGDLAVFDQRGDDRPVVVPSSEPAKSAFLRLRASGRIDRSTVLESISTRPSSRNSDSPGQRASA